MSWKIKRETENSVSFQEEREDAFVVVSIPKDLIDFIKENNRCPIEI